MASYADDFEPTVVAAVVVVVVACLGTDEVTFEDFVDAYEGQPEHA